MTVAPGSPSPTATVREMLPEDEAAVVRVLQRMRAGAEDYPPRIDVGADASELAGWLLEESSLVQLVAVAGRDVAGHVQLTEPHAYLVDRAASFDLAAQSARWAEVGSSSSILPTDGEGSVPCSSPP